MVSSLRKITALTRLQTLYLRRSRDFLHRPARDLAPLTALASLTVLTCLCLARKRVTAEAAHAIATLHALVQLDVREAQLGDAAMAVLGAALSSQDARRTRLVGAAVVTLTALTRLTLNHNRLGREAVSDLHSLVPSSVVLLFSFVCALGNLERLHHLDLSSNPLGVQDCRVAAVASMASGRRTGYPWFQPLRLAGTGSTF